MGSVGFVCVFGICRAFVFPAEVFTRNVSFCIFPLMWLSLSGPLSLCLRSFFSF